MKSNRALDEIQVTVINIRSLVAVTSECSVRGLSVKPGLGHWQTAQTQIRRRRTRHLIRVCTVCFNYRKLRIKRNSLTSRFKTIVPAYTKRQSTHQCCQYFDLSVEVSPINVYNCNYKSGIYQNLIPIKLILVKVSCNMKKKVYSAHLPSHWDMSLMLQTQSINSLSLPKYSFWLIHYQKLTNKIIYNEVYAFISTIDITFQDSI